MSHYACSLCRFWPVNCLFWPIGTLNWLFRHYSIWPVNCIKIGGHVALLSGLLHVYTLYCGYTVVIPYRQSRVFTVFTSTTQHTWVLNVRYFDDMKLQQLYYVSQKFMRRLKCIMNCFRTNTALFAQPGRAHLEHDHVTPQIKFVIWLPDEWNQILRPCHTVQFFLQLAMQFYSSEM